jgi:hypothetical protein
MSFTCVVIISVAVVCTGITIHSFLPIGFGNVLLAQEQFASNVFVLQN